MPLILDCRALTPLPVWVKTGKPQNEHMFSALPPEADIGGGPTPVGVTGTFWNQNSSKPLA
jgi:hypothetical protein